MNISDIPTAKCQARFWRTSWHVALLKANESAYCRVPGKWGLQQKPSPKPADVSPCKNSDMVDRIKHGTSDLSHPKFSLCGGKKLAENFGLNRLKKCNLTLAVSPLCNSICPLPLPSRLLYITVISHVTWMVQTPWFYHLIWFCLLVPEISQEWR